MTDCEREEMINLVNIQNYLNKMIFLYNIFNSFGFYGIICCFLFVVVAKRIRMGITSRGSYCPSTDSWNISGM